MIVYCATCSVTGKSYVGKTTMTLERRWKLHVDSALKQRDTFHFHRAIRKHGQHSFDLRVLQVCLATDELRNAEIHWISTLNTFVNGYNSTTGGDGASGYKHSDDSKHKMSLARKNKRRIIQFDLSGIEIARYDSISLAQHSTNINNIGYCCRRQLQSAGGFIWRYDGDVFDPKQPMNISPLARERYKTSQVKRRRGVCQLTMSGEVIRRFESITDAFSTTRICNIVPCCRGKRKSAGGYLWQYQLDQCDVKR